MRFLILCAALAVAGCSTPWQDPQRTDAFDGGGSIWARAQEIAEANAGPLGPPRPLPMFCASACSMELARRDACLRPGTKIGLHGPMWDGTEVMTGSSHELWARVMAAHYPEPIRALFWDGARAGSAITIIPGDAIVAAGIIPACPDD